MKIGILLWVYKDVPLCVNRARWLRWLNPDTPIYCLYGGPPADSDRFAAALRLLTDDFYVFKEPMTPHEKWLCCDRLLAAWHRDHGERLEWDTIFVAQWDLALLAPVRSLCGSLALGQVLFSGTRPVAAVRHFWPWLRPGSASEQEYFAFRDDLDRRDAFPVEPLCCNLVAAALPRAYLDRYVAEAPRIGFSEYKMTILAQSWGFDFCLDHKLDPRWITEGKRSRLQEYFAVLHAEGELRVRPKVLALNALLPGGHRAFHPFADTVPYWMASLPSIALQRHGRPAHRREITTMYPALS